MVSDEDDKAEDRSALHLESSNIEQLAISSATVGKQCKQTMLQI